MLAAGRVGVTVPKQQGYYEVAGCATVTIYDRAGLRLGTVYLAHMPQSRQETLSKQRLKLSGMRWSNEGGQAILTLRILLLSEIWDEVRDAMLKSIPSPVQATPAPQATTITQNAA